MTMTPLISVVIGSWNQCEVLNKVLASLGYQSCSPDLYEIIVIDSGSTDGTELLLGTFHPSCDFVYRIQENQGKAAARNAGVALARGAYILITDADMIAHHHFVKSHLHAHQQRKTPHCFEGNARNLTRLDRSFSKQKTFSQVGKERQNYSRLGWYYFLTGNISFPKSAFEQAGGFSTDFTGYGWEDIELGYRFHKMGIPLLFLKNAINYHFHLVSNTEDVKRYFEKGRSARIFLAKHPELKTFLGSNPLANTAYRIIHRFPGILNWLQSTTQNHRHILSKPACVILKEYHYRTGLLGD